MRGADIRVEEVSDGGGSEHIAGSKVPEFGKRRKRLEVRRYSRIVGLCYLERARKLPILSLSDFSTIPSFDSPSFAGQRINAQSCQSQV